MHAGGVYVLVNQNTDTCLDENQDNHWVRAWGRNGGDNQKWEVNRDGPRRLWWLRNIQSGRYLSHDGEGLGSALHTSEEQVLWHISDDEGGHRVQIHPDIDLHVDVKDASRDDDTVVLLWERKGNSQVWILEEA
ncbi:RICIN domain-containing protein [Nonomuraea sp. NEAU-A123]|uniref:RICIN domain-containing protein n=1 Tax=Nonomuraea sp. NEAU-A123 TaxID=2839649 RepID=UPI002546BDFA|nr:RICIN domain-containing protein [Nonomuraea sp. NEAU-A123]